MRDDNYDGIGKVAAPEIETLLSANQVNVLEAIARISIKLHQGKPYCGPIGDLVLRELHRAGLLFLVSDAGDYRDIGVCFAHGKHTPPEPADVPALMAEFYQELARHWDTRSPVENAAFAMWKINWIHPFRNGNGRTSRAFSYACLCLRAGIWLPGRPTVLEVLNNDPAAHARYAALLQLTDRTFEAGKLDLKPLADFLEELTIRQLSSIEEVAGIEVSEPASPPV